MSRTAAHLARAVVLAAVAAGIGRLATSDAYASYVRLGMRIPLLVTAGALLVLAVSNAWALGDPADLADGDGHGHGTSDGEHDHDHDHDHDHHAFPWVGALLLVPIICIAIVPILPLGSGAVTERRANVLATDAGRAGQPPAPPGDGELTLLDFMTRVVTVPDRPFTEPVTLTGFVASTSEADGDFVLGRFVMSCCAADAQPVLITVRWDGPAPPKDAWVEVTGTQVPAAPGLSDTERSDPANVVVNATEVRQVDQPAHPYLTG